MPDVALIKAIIAKLNNLPEGEMIEWEHGPVGLRPKLGNKNGDLRITNEVATMDHLLAEFLGEMGAFPAQVVKRPNLLASVLKERAARAKEFLKFLGLWDEKK